MRERSPRSERGRGTEDGLPDYSELCVVRQHSGHDHDHHHDHHHLQGETRLASHEDLDSLDSLTGQF